MCLDAQATTTSDWSCGTYCATLNILRLFWQASLDGGITIRASPMDATLKKMPKEIISKGYTVFHLFLLLCTLLLQKKHTADKEDWFYLGQRYDNEAKE